MSAIADASATHVPAAEIMDDIRQSPAFLPCAAAIGVFAWFAADEGGFEATTWLPGSLLVLGLLAISLAVLPRPRPSGAAWAAVLFLAAYAAWSYVSIAWARQKGIAWDGANRTLLYAAVLALFALWPMRPRAALLILGGFGLSVAVIGLVELLRANWAADANAFFFEARLSEPVGYVNANVALWSSAVWPCLIVAARREVNPIVRGTAIGGATVLMGLTLMGQSRGWLVALPVVALVAVLIVPGRGRTIAALAALGLGCLVMARPALDVYDTFEPGADLGPALAEATSAILVAAAVLAVAGVIAGLLDRRVRVGPPAARRVNLSVIAAAVVLAIAGLGALTASEGNLVTYATDYWDEFKEGGDSPSVGQSRLTGTAATDRYDFWRVGMEMFEERPLVGFGADNYQQEYFVRGKGSQQPRYPHSLQVRVLSQTGLVGALLLAAAFGAAAVGVAPLLLRDRGLGGALAGAALLVTVYWLAHGSFDWLWEFAGLGAPAFAMLGVALALAQWPRANTAKEATSGRSPRRVAAVVAGVVVLLAASASLGATWVAELDTRRAAKSWRADPQAAFDRLDRAARFNPLSVRPVLTSGAVAIGVDQLRKAERDFRSVLERDPRDAYAHLQLAAIASERGQRGRALSLLERAVRLNPRYAVSRSALRSVQRGRRLDPSQLNRNVTRATRSRIGLE